MDGAAPDLPDFFISRTGVDAPMATKVGQILEAAGHRVVLQQWDFANRNFLAEIDAALASGARVISILTPQYLLTDYCAAEWMHTLAGDPLNRKGKLIVLRAAECEPKGLLRTIAYWDLIQVRDDDDRLADIVKAAIMPDADRRLAPAARYWRHARPLIHEAIKPTPSFTGRDSHLLKIDRALWSGRPEAAAITQPAAVTGLGGIGKSALAREYAWQAQEGYTGVWWLNAASDKDAVSWEGVEQGLVDLGDHYIPGLVNAQDRAKAAQYTLDFLAHGGFSKPWLLIYDNVDDPRVLQSWSPKGNVHVLVTTRISNWSMGMAPIEVDAWALPEATAYLVKETGRDDLSESSLAELAEALGRLPLALAHAAAYLRRRKAVTVRDYIADLDRHMSGLPNDAEYRNPVYATFRAALAQAEEEAPGATALMSLAAFFAPGEIPEELFEQDAKLYPTELASVVAKRELLADTLGVLDDLSLIQFEPEARAFSAHRIVQAAARDALAHERETWAQRAVAIAFAAFPGPAQETWPQCARLVSHVRALHAHLPTEAASPELGWLLGAAGEYSHERAALADVLPLFNASLAIAERLAKADPGNAGWQRDLSVSHDRIGDVLRAQGNLPAALDAFNASLAIAERLAKADPGNAGWQRDLSVSHNKIGDVLRAQGNLPAALDAFNASLAIAERLAKADPGNAGWQRDLSVSHDRIGDVLVEQGNLPAALDAFNASLAIAERLAKADPGNAGWQRDLAVSNERVGDLHAQTGSMDKAREAFQRALGAYEGLVVRYPGDVPSQVFSVVPRWRLSRLDPASARQHLEAALLILKPLAAAGRLDANRKKWIDQMETELAEL